MNNFYCGHRERLFKLFDFVKLGAPPCNNCHKLVEFNIAFVT